MYKFLFRKSWHKYKKKFFNINLIKRKGLIRIRLDNKVLANKNKVNKVKFKSHIIVGLITLTLHFDFVCYIVFNIT